MFKLKIHKQVKINANPDYEKFIEISNALHKAHTIINNLTMDNFSFSIGNSIIKFNPKEIIETAKKIKTINGNTVYKVKLPNLYSQFDFKPLLKNDFNNYFDVKEEEFKKFKKEFSDFDEAEIKCSYITAVFSSPNIKENLLNKIRKCSDDKAYIHFSSTIDTMYGLTDWSVPFLYNNNREEFVAKDRFHLFHIIIDILNDAVRYAEF